MLTAGGMVTAVWYDDAGTPVYVRFGTEWARLVGTGEGAKSDKKGPCCVHSPHLYDPD